MTVGRCSARQASSPNACWIASRTEACAAGRRCPGAAAGGRFKVAFPVRKGILRRVVDHHRVVNSLSFQLRAGETLGPVGNRVPVKYHRPALLRLIPSGAR